MTKKTPSRLGKAIVEMAADQHRLGILDTASFEKITVRNLGPATLASSKPISPGQIRSVRVREKLSQAALARYLDVTAGYVSQLERGVKTATGPVRVLLNVVRRTGIEALN